MAETNPTTDNPEKLITLPLSVQASLLFGTFYDKDLPRSPILSRAPGDNASVVLTHYPVGALIAHVDSDESIFHVELYKAKTVISEPHAELWIAAEWKTSNARYTRIKAHSQAQRDERAEHEELATLLADDLASWCLPGTHAQIITETDAKALAYQIASSYKIVDLSAIIKMWDLTEVLKNYEESKKQQATKET